MKPDLRNTRLHAFRLACRISCAGLAIGAAGYAIVAVVPLLSQADAVSPLHAALSAHLLALHVLTFAQIVLGALLFGAAGLPGEKSPFSNAFSNSMLVLGVLFAAQAALKPFIVSEACDFLFAGEALKGQAITETLDVSGILIAACFIIGSFLIRYGRELRIDSDEIA